MSDPSELPPGTAPADETNATQGSATQGNGTPDQAPEATPAERIAALEAEVAQLRDRWLRAEAETQNLRARTQRDVADARNYAIQKFRRGCGRGGAEPAPRPRSPCRPHGTARTPCW